MAPGYFPNVATRQMSLGNPERNARLDLRVQQKWTRLPCPCCLKGMFYRPEGEVCDNCLVMLWRTEDAEIAKEQLDVLSVSPGWPMAFKPRNDDAVVEPVNTVRDLLRGLLTHLTADRVEPLVDTGVGEPTLPGRIIRPGPRSALGTMNALNVNTPAGSGDYLEQLPGALDAALAAIYEGGVAAGTNLISRLASGEITVDNFDAMGKSTR
jgi:hypothetical protein